MNLLGFFSFIVYAAELIISPLQDNINVPYSSTIQAPVISFGQLISQNSHTQHVLGAESLPLPTPTPAPIATPTPTPIPHATRKPHMTIALLGDSMIETLGSGVPDLERKLSSYYPQSSFTILNYGVGSTNIDDGIKRLTTDFVKNSQKVPSLVSREPDLTIVESFAYNHYPMDEMALTRHWLSMATIVDILKKHLPQASILFASTITPNAKTFGDGAPSISYSDIEKHEHVVTIKAFLDNTVRFARSENIPLANAYNPSVMRDGNGNWTYISPVDHIHYSTKGRLFFVDTLFDTIVDNKLLE